MHEPPAAIELPQVLVWLNGPLTLTDETEAAVVPGFDTVTVWPRSSTRPWCCRTTALDGDAVSGELVPPLPAKDM